MEAATQRKKIERANPQGVEATVVDHTVLLDFREDGQVIRPDQSEGSVVEAYSGRQLARRQAAEALAAEQQLQREQRQIKQGKVVGNLRRLHFVDAVKAVREHPPASPPSYN
jgi:hypothetical protein